MTSPLNPTKYLGPNVYLANIVVRNREPTGADYRQPETGKNYVIFCGWQVGKDPTTGTEGDLWLLSKIVANVAYWIKISSGVTPSGAVLSISDTANTPVFPTVGGNIQLEAGAGMTIVSDAINNKLVVSLTGGGTGVDTFTTNVGGPVNPTALGVLAVNASTTTFTDGATLNTLKTEVQAVTNGILYGQGANTPSATITPSIDGVLISSHTGIPSWLANGTAGQVLTANTNLPPSWQTNANGNVAGPGSSTDRAISTWNGVNGDALFDNPSTRITAAGEMTNTLQPAFLGYLAVDDTNATGNSAPYTLGTTGTALTEVFDQGNDFTTLGVFTAPVTGKYHIGSLLCFGALTAAMNESRCNLRTSNGVYQFGEINVGAVRTGSGLGSMDGYQLNCDVLTEMDASDTFTVDLAIGGGAGDTATVGGSGSRRVNMYGHLVC